ncbi:MAG: hypothetical protein ACJAWL_003722 [Motiliproteus sp.]|jgi:hypothetical protein
MQVVLSTIGYFRVNTSNLYLSFGAIRRAEFLFTQSALRCAVASLIAYFSVWRGLRTFSPPVGDKQVCNAEIDANYIGIHPQFFRLELTQAGSKYLLESLEVVMVLESLARLRLQRTANGSFDLAM